MMAVYDPFAGIRQKYLEISDISYNKPGATLNTAVLADIRF